MSIVMIVDFGCVMLVENVKNCALQSNFQVFSGGSRPLVHT